MSDFFCYDVSMKKQELGGKGLSLFLYPFLLGWGHERADVLRLPKN